MRVLARVLGRVGGQVVLQLPGGLLALPDPAARLRTGDTVGGEFLPAGFTATEAALCFRFEARQEGPLALLTSGGSTTPLVLEGRVALPECVDLHLRVTPAEVAEGAPIPGPAPNGSGCACRNFSREEVRAATWPTREAPTP